MATTTHTLLLRLSILLGLLAVAANARPGRHFHPCKTLIFFSASANQNPNDFSPQNPFSLSRGPSLTFFITEIREIEPKPMIIVDRARIDDDKEENRPLPFGFYSSVGASLRDRTKDILRVVGSLLFGVGCGALTAATLYLIWSLFATNRFELRDSDEDDFDDYDASPKKMGYVAVPAAEAPVAALPAKEVV